MNTRFKDIQTRNATPDISEQLVVMANDMVKGTSKLTLMEAKLLRYLIMMIKPHDQRLEAYRIDSKDLAEKLKLNEDGIYRAADRMTDHLMKEVICIGDGNPKHPWKKFHWLDVCEYNNGTFTFKLSDELAPYLINLRKWYTQYRLEDIVSFKSVHAIRIFELMAYGMKNNVPFGDAVTEIFIDIDTIRKATNTVSKYESAFAFKKKVMDAAIADINARSGYHVEYHDYKEGRRIAGFIFRIQSKARYNYRERVSEDAQEEEAQIEGQMSISDFIPFDEEG